MSVKGVVDDEDFHFVFRGCSWGLPGSLNAKPKALGVIEAIVSAAKVMIAFTGGLIGPQGADLHHEGDLEGMPALFSSGDPDPHVPWSRVLESAQQFTAMGAAVKTQRYPGRPHTVFPQETKAAHDLIFGSLGL